ncbi:TRAP transporter large permease subunit [Moraxella bovis]|uniref:TRAP transporter large permease subunit n=1 Tax=Moraxella bovis TaxID=476 RepID=A0AAQ2Q0Z7_MORBO|nr:Na+/H+ antiporter NhaC family protein [Moraxella bovis]AWY20740.1 sodium:proton antiporter [Moraxella bovis]OOR92601.1 sodium:proton antiporter [Moraxella bovis]UYZ76579.1 TRAP transporter large permease subunit [Moraxella bovis]UYZ77469.1 TRAP transporter large permease subunit [Moraxella bovis]UYZ82052.1 TRAP transporter large permease subunit [Moraxella bovis]
MNAVLLAVIIMVGLSLARVHVVLSLIVGAVVGGLLAGLPLTDVENGATGVLTHFQNGIKGGAGIALSYAMLGAFAMAIAHSGVPKALADKVILAVKNAKNGGIKWAVFGVIVLFACLSQNLIPIHIAFILLLIPPLLTVFNELKLDRRLITCLITFGLVNTYMFIPYGFGDIFLNEIIMANLAKSGLDTSGISVMKAMAIPALGMLTGLLVAIFVSYRKPRVYDNAKTLTVKGDDVPVVNDTKMGFKIIVTLIAIIVAFVIQLKTDSLVLGSLSGFAIFMATGVVGWSKADDVFNNGIKMMAMIGFIMITAQGFAEVMTATGHIEPLVQSAVDLFGANKALASLAMLMVGLVVTMGIGSSFSTVPIIATMYVPLCMAMGFSPMATLALVATAGVLGDAGSPASDSTLGPTMGLNVDGQHDHIKDSVIPTFIHYNIPLIVFGWVASLVL